MSSLPTPVLMGAYQRVQRNWSLWRTLVRQEMEVRYRGTLLGRLWPVLLPLLSLAMYGFVFGVVFRARWPGLEDGDHLGFVLNLFAGLLVHGMLNESVGQAPTLMQRNSNFVRKMVFPLSVLVAVPLGPALVHVGVSLLILVLVAAVVHGTLHATVLAAPLIMLPYAVMLYGLCLFIAALGVYLRDLGQVINVFVFLMLFTSPVFYPADMVPEAVVGIINYNPITWPVSALRDAVLHGQWPGLQGWLTYSAASTVVLLLGWACFRVLRRGFADLL